MVFYYPYKFPPEKNIFHILGRYFSLTHIWMRLRKGSKPSQFLRFLRDCLTAKCTKETIKLGEGFALKRRETFEDYMHEIKGRLRCPSRKGEEREVL